MFILLAEGQIGPIIIMCVLIAAIIGLFVWQSISNKKKQEQAAEIVQNLKVGDKVKTIGGVCGFVAEINDKENTFVLKTGMEGKDSYVKFDKAAIYQTAPAKSGKTEKGEKAEEVKEDVKQEVKEEVKTEEKKESKSTKNKKLSN